MIPLADIPGDPQTLRNPRHWGIPLVIPGGYRGRFPGTCLQGILCGVSWVITRESHIPQWDLLGDALSDQVALRARSRQGPLKDNEQPTG